MIAFVITFILKLIKLLTNTEKYDHSELKLQKKSKIIDYTAIVILFATTKLQFGIMIITSTDEAISFLFSCKFYIKLNI